MIRLGRVFQVLVLGDSFDVFEGICVFGGGSDLHTH